MNERIIPSDCRAVVVWTGELEQPAAAPSPIVTQSEHRGTTLSDVIAAYQTDPLSSFHKMRFSVRQNHVSLLRRISARHGTTPLAVITGRMVIEWHLEWLGPGKVSMAHAFVAQLRTLFGFGFALLADRECERLVHVLHTLKFAQGKSRVDRLTAEQADAVRHWAHVIGWHSIALAQAFQFELMLRQRDVIGEWVPIDEKVDEEPIIDWRGEKWLRGLRWSEVDDDLILRHVTSKRQKPIVVDLKNAPMVMEELCGYVDEIPIEDEPIILCEASCMPFTAAEFRRKWRIVADYAGIPRNVRNMDSRSGAISEAFDAGIKGEQIQKNATHSDLAMTQKYNRGDYLANSNEIAMMRAASRKNRARDSDTRTAAWHSTPATSAPAGAKRRANE